MPRFRLSAVVNTIRRPSLVRIKKPLGWEPKTSCGGPLSTITCQEMSLHVPTGLLTSAANEASAVATRATRKTQLMKVRILMSLQTQLLGFAVAAPLPVVALPTVLRGKIARHSRKMLGRNAASALVSQSLASKPGRPTCVLGISMFNTRLAVNVIAHG